MENRENKAYLVLSSNSRADRQKFLDTLIEAGAGGIEEHPQFQEFLEGTGDIALSDITLDSLAVMEVAIAIEESFGVSLAPDRIINFSMLGQLWLSIAGVGSVTGNRRTRKS